MRFFLLALSFLSVPAFAEYGRYGEVTLHGLSRTGSWQQYEPGVYSSMVCDVNGVDGFLAVRSGPSTHYPILRKLERLAIVNVDTRYRQGNWIYVRTAYRVHNINGYRRRNVRNLHVEGWSHSRYLCDFSY